MAPTVWETRGVRLLAVLALGACGGATRGASNSTQPPYLSLFSRGRSWTLPIETVDGLQRGEQYVVTKTGRATLSCTVAEVKQIANADVARVTCAKPHDSLLIVGWWVSTQAGLYHPALPIDDADDLSLFGDIDLLLPARPTEYEHTEAVDGVQHAVESFRHGSDWCARDTMVAAQERRHYTLCFGEHGVTGGGDLAVDGGEWHRTTFGAVPVDAADPTLEE
jgi:hypothetical protein